MTSSSLVLLLTWVTSLQAALDTCGRTSIKQSDITGGPYYAEAGEFPHMCFLSTEEGEERRIVGGASLVTRGHLVTLATGLVNFRNTSVEEAKTAECEDSLGMGRPISVTCGGFLSGGSPSSQTRSVSRIIVHPDYHPQALTNDIAVLVVSPPFSYSDTVGRVCLPGPGEEVEAGQNCVATGHGREGYGKPFSVDLRKLDLLLVDQATCEERLNKEFFRGKGVDNWRIDPSFLCARGEEGGQDVCQGDGGGPLVCKKQAKGNYLEGIIDPVFGFDLRTGSEVEDFQLLQVGVIAWGIQCGATGLPSVYTNLAAVSNRCWLDQVISCYDPTHEGLNRAELEFVCSDWLNSLSADRATCDCERRLEGNTENFADLRNIDDYEDTEDVDYVNIRKNGQSKGETYDVDYETLRKNDN